LTIKEKSTIMATEKKTTTTATNETKPATNGPSGAGAAPTGVAGEATAAAPSAPALPPPSKEEARALFEAWKGADAAVAAKEKELEAAKLTVSDKVKAIVERMGITGPFRYSGRVLNAAKTKPDAAGNSRYTFREAHSEIQDIA
jgi:hypothetical protein